MLQLKNDVALSTSMAIFPNEAGIDTLYVVTKAALILGATGQPTFAEKAPPVVLADEFGDEPETSSLRATTELHTGKAGTDVVLCGHAWAPGGRPVPESLVRVTVAERAKTVRVFGDRAWRSHGLSKPLPFESVPLVFERAFGGSFHDDHGKTSAEERNPVGRGFLGKRAPSVLDGQLAPNLEDPKQPLAQPGDTQAPACFAFIAPSWLPRRARAGTYDADWQRRRAPYLPRDFQPAFFNAAAPELAFERFLTGGENVEVLGARREGPLRFQLPRWVPKLEVTLAGQVEVPLLLLETVLIEPDENRVSLSWRAAVPCDKKVQKIEHVTVRGPAGSVQTSEVEP